MINAEERISKLEKQIKRLINQICCADEPVSLAWGAITGTLSNQTDLATELGNLGSDITTLQGDLATKEDILTFTSPYFTRVGDTISIVDAVSDQVTKGIATFNSNDFNSLNGLISLDYASGQAASATLNGYMTTGTQAFAGNKTWGGTSTFNNTFQVGGTVNGSIGIASSAASVRGNIDLSSNNPRLNSATGTWLFAQSGNTIGSYNSTGWFFGGGTTPADAFVSILAGTTALAQLKLISSAGVVKATPVNGCFEYNGTNLFFTRASATRESILTGNSGATAPTTTAGVVITNFYGTSATNFLGDPNSWASVVIGGTTYKIPLYT